MSKKPPRIAAFLLRCVLPPKDQDYLLGDYEESFQTKLQKKGASSASLWYRGAVGSSSPRLSNRVILLENNHV
jgi:hypothetical protein